MSQSDTLHNKQRQIFTFSVAACRLFDSITALFGSPSPILREKRKQRLEFIFIKAKGITWAWHTFATWLSVWHFAVVRPASRKNKIISKTNMCLLVSFFCEGIQRVVQVYSVHDFSSGVKPIFLEDWWNMFQDLHMGHLHDIQAVVYGRTKTNRHRSTVCMYKYAII